ncbi:RNase H domain-containing protein [Trichonephila clavipes]|nr:RNase H domain-containing protein [Trichonephila clavipes]
MDFTNTFIRPSMEKNKTAHLLFASNVACLFSFDDKEWKAFDHFAKVSTPNGIEVSVPTPRSYVIKTLQNKLIKDWDSWWSNSNTGLRVKSFFPKHSLDINPHSSYVTQFLTNHGPFVSYLHRFKLKTTPKCLCGSVGDADHYVFACPLTKDFHLVSPSQNAKKAWFQSIVRNSSIHCKLKSCIKIAYSIRDQIP